MSSGAEVEVRGDDDGPKSEHAILASLVVSGTPECVPMRLTAGSAKSRSQRCQGALSRAPFDPVVLELRLGRQWVVTPLVLEVVRPLLEGEPRAAPDLG